MRHFGRMAANEAWKDKALTGAVLALAELRAMERDMPHRFRVKAHVSVACFAVRDTNALRRVVPLVVP